MVLEAYVLLCVTELDLKTIFFVMKKEKMGQK